MKSALALTLLLAVPVLATAQTPAPAPAPDFPRGKVVDKVDCAATPGETYALYLPSGYTPDRSWPILFILDPRARGPLAAEKFRAGAEKHGYILASSNSSQSDVAWDPNTKAMRAMWTDTHSRFRIDDRRVYAAGFSGTVRAAITLARAVPGTIAGIVGAGAGFPFEAPPRKGDPFVFFGTIGTKDFNWYEMMDLEPRLEDTGIVHRIEIFDGVHQWPPEPLAVRALDWMELQAMKAGTRPKDPALIEAFWKDTLERARAFESSGDLFLAWRTWSGAAADFAGLRDTAEAAAKSAEIKANPAFQRDLKDREARMKQDKEFLARAPQALSGVDSDGQAMTLSQVISALKIRDLKKKAESSPIEDERLSAQRVLNTLAGQTGFYLPQKFSERKQWDRVVFFLSIAAEIAPEDYSVFYDRAAAYAQKGDRKRAIADLRQAVQKGYKDLPALEKDQAFNSVRQEEGYKEVVKSLAAAAPATKPGSGG
jgi:tetratricopeptide (TPR) repeat protein